MKLAPARLLLVDDEIQLHELIGGMLEELPVNLSYALTGEQGIEIIEKSEEFAVIISNHNLGTGISGVEFLKWVKKYYPNTSRILITGGIDEDSLSAMVDSGDIDDFSLKPILIDNFIKQVNSGINAYRGN